MRALAINCGSSTLKFQLFELQPEEKGYGQEPQQELHGDGAPKTGCERVTQSVTEDNKRPREAQRNGCKPKDEDDAKDDQTEYMQGSIIPSLSKRWPVKISLVYHV